MADKKNVFDSDAIQLMGDINNNEQVNSIHERELFSSTSAGNLQRNMSVEHSKKGSGGFQVDKVSIPCISMEDEDQELNELSISVYDQSQFETEVMGQVDKALKKEEQERRKKLAERKLKTVSVDIQSTKQRLEHLEKALKSMNQTEMTLATNRSLISLKKEQENKLQKLKTLESQQKTLNACIAGNAEGFDDMESNDGAVCHSEETYTLQQAFAFGETEEEKLVRTGQMTPFGTILPARDQNKSKIESEKVVIPPNQLTAFDRFLLEQSEREKKIPKKKVPKVTSKAPPAHAFLQPSTSKMVQKEPDNSHSAQSTPAGKFTTVARTVKRRKKKMKLGTKYAVGAKRVSKAHLFGDLQSNSDVSDYENMDQIFSDDSEHLSDKDYVPDELPSENSEFEDYSADCYTKVGKKKSKEMSASETEPSFSVLPNKASKGLKASPSKRQQRVIDDGSQQSYIKRIKKFEKLKLIEKHQKILESEDGVVDSDDESYMEFDGEFKIPNSPWDKLYRYQQTGVRWLWELHQQQCGGIIGDEMGLGKTIQIIVFLVGLKISNLHIHGDNFEGLGPVILVCPTTVMHQWVKEFHKWWPPFRVAILHESGSYAGKKEGLVSIINQRSGILITSYNGLVQHQECLLNYEWHYVILDEGHKIRNPDAQATLAAKQFRTAHRIILSGSPIQNNLKELWSLFDFVFPGKLGTLPIFMQQFSVPIVLGGYANATQVQVQTAYKCATVLRDTIKPYLLRRMKDDVKTAINLPNKSEQVLFCQLAEDQMQLYKDYLASPQIESIVSGRLQIFVGLINLRKICNHPDLYTGGPKIFKDTDIDSLSEDMHYGYFKRSGKMLVVKALLRLWHKQGHRVLLFTQGRQMMEILEIFVKRCEYTYMKMDGSTSISSRQPAIAKFNSDPNIFIFLLTTRVGGIGVNLTAADRIIIYDPDWNPSTDVQARERSWRIGQDKQVTIYRLLTSGTIEEKIYHRQIFKQFVTNRVLKDPRQRRFFKSNDLYELFTFKEPGKQGTETSAIFAGTGSEIKPVKRPKNQIYESQKKMKNNDSPSETKKADITIEFSEEKIKKMKELAKRLSMQFLKGPAKQDDYKGASKVPLSIEQNVVSNSEEMNLHVSSEKKNHSHSRGKLAPHSMSSKDASINPRFSVNKSDEKKRRKKLRTSVVEGEKIKYLVKKDEYKASVVCEEEKPSTSDDYVLSRLFKKSGVHTALKHDVIVDAADPDYMLVEGEANKVAQDAIKALKQSRRQCARAVDGIPTWTGASGGVKPRFGLKKKLPPTCKTQILPCDITVDEAKPGPSGIVSKKASGVCKTGFGIGSSVSSTTEPVSSSDLLAAIKQRKEAFGADAGSDRSLSENSSSSEEDSSQPVAGSSTEYDDLLTDIRNFVAFGAATDGQATTKEILSQFKDKLPIHQTAVFKSLLSNICDFFRTSNGSGMWSLKPEFR